MSFLNAVWLSRHVVAQRLVAAQRTLFGKYLLLTNTGICMASSGLGDSLQQQYERLRGRAHSWDSVRSRRIVGSAMVIGPTCHFWYQWLDRRFPGVSLATISRKVLLDQLIFSPVNISLFLALMGIQEGLSRSQIWAELRDKGWTLFKAEWVVWPPAQFVNFYLLPTRYRVLFDSTVSLFFDYYYSYVKFCKKDDTEVGSKSCDSSTEDQEVCYKNCDSPTEGREVCVKNCDKSREGTSIDDSLHKQSERPVVNHHRWKTYMYLYMDDNHHSFTHSD